jgi:hypothetical protein
MSFVRFDRIGSVFACAGLRRKPATAVGGWPNMSPRVCCAIFPKHTKVVLSRHHNCAKSLCPLCRPSATPRLPCAWTLLIRPSNFLSANWREKQGPDMNWRSSDCWKNAFNQHYLIAVRILIFMVCNRACGICNRSKPGAANVRSCETKLSIFFAHI